MELELKLEHILKAVDTCPIAYDDDEKTTNAWNTKELIKQAVRAAYGDAGAERTVRYQRHRANRIEKQGAGCKTCGIHEALEWGKLSQDGSLLDDDNWYCHQHGGRDL